MFRNILALLLVLTACLSLWSAPLEDVSKELARAQALYYEAEFTKSIEVLLPVDELLRSQPGQLADKTSVKLQLALAYMGLNDNVRARVFFRELFALDSNHSLDAQQFSPKVLMLADEARAEQIDLECKTVLTDAERQLAAANAEAVVGLIGRNQSKCPGLHAIASDTAELLFKNGLDAYRKAQLPQALEKLRTALKLDPEHELAADYIELAETKLDLEADRVFLAWRKEFNAGAYAAAGVEYRRLLTLSDETTISQVRAEYRRTLSDVVDSWTRACGNNDIAGMEQARSRAGDLAPEPSIGEGLLEKMSNCRNTACVEMSAGVALARLKTRVDPEFPPSFRPSLDRSPITVRVKAKIDEEGNVTATDPQGGSVIINDAVRAAVDKWKFHPAVIGTQARCVATELSIVINFIPPAGSQR